MDQKSHHQIAIQDILHSGKPTARLEACEYVYRYMVKNRPSRVEITEEHASQVLFQVIQKILSTGGYASAARLLWGKSFTFKPQNVKRLWQALMREEKLGVIGAGGLGKSYNIIGYLFLDLLRDLPYTTIKIASSTAGSADANIWSQVTTLYKNSSIAIPAKLNTEYLGIDSAEKKFGMERIAIPAGEQAKGRLRGKCHPFPRVTPHPEFGSHSRSRVFLDEAEAIPANVWLETGNVLQARDGSKRVQVISASNTYDPQSEFAKEMEPPEGWDDAREKDLKSWKSKKGWHVIRLDGADCENVIEKKVVFPGMMTYEGYNQHIVNGEPTPLYWILSRGIYPPAGLDNVCIPMFLLTNAIGAFRFTGRTENYSGVDTALEGGDRCIQVFARRGMADGFMRQDGTTIEFDYPRYCTQFEQVTEHPKGDSVMMASNIIQACKTFGVLGQNLAVDSTGNGEGVHSILLHTFSQDVHGVNYGRAATDMRLIEEDKDPAYMQYFGITTEMFFAVRKHLEAGVLAISPGYNRESTFEELATRRYRQKPTKDGLKLMAESKHDFKARRRSRSPDYADAFTICLHGVRLNEANPPERMPGVESVASRDGGIMMEPTAHEKLEFIDFGE